MPRGCMRGRQRRPALGPEQSAGVRLAAADLLLASAPDEALGIITDVRRAAPPEPYAGEAGLLVGEYAALRSDWNRALDVFSALEGSRADDIGARAAIQKGRALESVGRTADAVDEYLKVGYLFPDLPGPRRGGDGERRPCLPRARRHRPGGEDRAGASHQLPRQPLDRVMSPQ